MGGVAKLLFNKVNSGGGHQGKLVYIRSNTCEPTTENDDSTHNTQDKYGDRCGVPVRGRALGRGSD